jgi:hypothetical protein
MHFNSPDVKQLNITRYLNGFIVGFVFGALLIFVGLTLFNLYCSWQSCPPMVYTWWNFIPLPLLMGISMAVFVANYTLRD